MPSSSRCRFQRGEADPLILVVKGRVPVLHRELTQDPEAKSGVPLEHPCCRDKLSARRWGRFDIAPGLTDAVALV